MIDPNMKYFTFSAAKFNGNKMETLREGMKQDDDLKFQICSKE